MRNKKNRYSPYLIFFGLIVIFSILFTVLNTNVHNFTYDEFVNKLQKKEIKTLSITPNQQEGVYKIHGQLKKYEKNESFRVNVPLSETSIALLLKGESEEKFGYKLEVKSDPQGNVWLNLIANLLPIILIGGFFFWFVNQQLSSSGRGLDFGKSKAKLSDNAKKVTFKDVAGLKEEKEEVKEIIDFLKNPKKFTKMGARIPKGLLLVGPPGTGKTLLAKAVAGEADVPFYFISGSDFVELFVGVGASRVRDMFKEAKMNAPCLIFIDEIDAVGRQRGSGIGGGHDEREQTLNQLLTEMDGFGENEGIIIMAATNRADVLDPALLRPGRFDRQVTVDLPDKNERKEILEVHGKNKKFDEKVSFKNLAHRTPGFSGADLENVLNESALLAVRRNLNKIGMSEIDEATDRVIGGPAKTSRKYTPHEKKVVAYHEAGHAVLGLKLKDSEEVHKITIIPRGDAGGYTLMLPKEETYFSSKSQLIDRITGLLGGRVSEELIFNEVTTGAHNDIERATKIARAMVTEYGMSDLGTVQYEAQTHDVFLGRDYNKTKNFSDSVALEIDQEVKKIIDYCKKRAKDTLSKNKDLLDLLANTLLEKETLTKEEIESLEQTGKLPEINELASLTVDELKEKAKNLNVKDYNKMKKQELIDALEDIMKE